MDDVLNSTNTRAVHLARLALAIGAMFMLEQPQSSVMVLNQYFQALVHNHKVWNLRDTERWLQTVKYISELCDEQLQVSYQIKLACVFAYVAQVFKIRTLLGAFNGCTVKPLRFWCNHTRIQALEKHISKKNTTLTQDLLFVKKQEHNSLM